MWTRWRSSSVPFADDDGCPGCGESIVYGEAIAFCDGQRWHSDCLRAHERGVLWCSHKVASTIEDIAGEEPFSSMCEALGVSPDKVMSKIVWQGFCEHCHVAMWSDQVLFTPPNGSGPTAHLGCHEKAKEEAQRRADELPY